jgi:hypothetical protein
LATTDRPDFYDTAIAAWDCDDGPATVEVTYSREDYGPDRMVLGIVGEYPNAALTREQATQLRDALTAAIAHFPA